MSPKIIINVSPNGETKVRTEGFVGSACQKASQFIERALGSTVSEQLTQDFYMSSTESASNALNQGEEL